MNFNKKYAIFLCVLFLASSPMSALNSARVVKIATVLSSITSLSVFATACYLSKKIIPKEQAPERKKQLTKRVDMLHHVSIAFALVAMFSSTSAISYEIDALP